MATYILKDSTKGFAP